MSRSGDGGADHDDATPSTASTSGDAPSPHVHYAVNFNNDTVVESAQPESGERGGAFVRSDTSRSGAFSPIIRRRTGRAATFKTFEDFDDFEARPGWRRMSIFVRHKYQC